jgi:hypothetical protein
MRRGHVEAIVKEAGLHIDPLAAWLLWRLGAYPRSRIDAVGVGFGVDRAVRDSAVRELVSRGLIEIASGDTAGPAEVTGRGREWLRELAAARRRRFEEMFASWTVTDRAALADVLRSFATGVAGEAPSVT